MATILIVCPLRVEWDTMCQHINDIQDVSDSRIIAKQGHIGNYDIFCALIGKGPICQTNVVNAISIANPRYVFLLGICGGCGYKTKNKNVLPSLSLGDVAIPKKVFGYDLGKILSKQVYKRSEDLDFIPDENLNDRLSYIANYEGNQWREKIKVKRPSKIKKDPDALCEYFASGNKAIDDINNVITKKFLNSIDYNIRAFEMEAAETFIAIHKEMEIKHFGFHMIRGVSDFQLMNNKQFIKGKGKTKKGSAINANRLQRKGCQKYAADVAAAFLDYFLQRYPNLGSEPEWETFVDQLLNVCFDSINTQTDDKSIRDLLKNKFNIRLTITPGEDPIPKIHPCLDLKRIDPYIILESRINPELTLKRHILISAENYIDIKNYVPPNNFNEILEHLFSNRFLILCGEPGLGKTMTAFHILQKFIENGIVPREMLLSHEQKYIQEVNPGPYQIIFIDDPFGKEKPLLKEILLNRFDAFNNFIDKSKMNPGKNGFLVITVRANIYEYLQNLFSIYILNKFDNFICHVEYTFKQSRQILLNYAKLYKCFWYDNIKNGHCEINFPQTTILPLNLKHLCYNNQKNIDFNELNELLDKYKYEAAKMRHYELTKCKREDLVYILFSQYLHTQLISEKKISTIFHDLLKELTFDYGLSWENYKKKYELWYTWSNSGSCRFLHSTILEAISNFSRDDMAFKQLICNILNLFYKDNGNIEKRLLLTVGLSSLFNYLDSKTRNILDEVLDSNNLNDDFYQVVGQSIGHNLSVDDDQVVKNQLTKYLKVILKQIKNENIKGLIGSCIIDNSIGCGNELVEEVINLSKDPYLGESFKRRIAWAIASNFGSLDENAQSRMLDFLSEKESSTWIKMSAAEAIADNIEQANEMMGKALFKLWQNTDAQIRRAIIGAIEYNFTEFPEKFRKGIIHDAIQEKDFAVIEWMIWLIENNFQNMKEDFNKEVFEYLKEVSENPDPRVRRWVAESLVNNYKNLTSDLIELLMVLREDSSTIVREATLELFKEID